METRDWITRIIDPSSSKNLLVSNNYSGSSRWTLGNDVMHIQDIHGVHYKSRLSGYVTPKQSVKKIGGSPNTEV